jgi:malate dehydrogenase (oxaloacetate-decarboxylating)
MSKSKASSSRSLPRGQALLELPQYNKGTAFSWDERLKHGLLGLLPPHEETLEQQVARAYRAYEAKSTDLERHIYLRQLQDFNEILFYRLIMNYPADMIPIIYTPTVGDACKKFSEIYRKPRGLFVSYPERDYVDMVLENAAPDMVEAVVITDSEAILGIGDQGAGGMGIPIGKLALYTALGGVDPNVCLPILLDVGTNNQALLDDPLYIGWPEPRISGTEYDEFVDQVLQAIRAKWPGALIQFEDFGTRNASRLLERYRDKFCSFNDDIQGTAAVTMGTVLAACRAAGTEYRDAKVVIVGAGSAGCGIAEQLMQGLVAAGLEEAEARSRFYLIDRDGLVREGLERITPQQSAFLRKIGELDGWQGEYGLLDVVRNVQPNVLIGVSGQPGMFSAEVVETMAEANERPIIFPLSNPTERAEARPDDVIRWSGGRALVATGSPFPPVIHDGTTYHVAQCNNAYAFPGIGLGVLAVNANRITDAMLMKVAETIGDSVDAGGSDGAALLPPLTDIRPLSRKIAVAVARCAVEEGLCEDVRLEDVEARVDESIWVPQYRPC